MRRLDSMLRLRGLTVLHLVVAMELDLARFEVALDDPRGMPWRIVDDLIRNARTYTDNRLTAEALGWRLKGDVYEVAW